MNAKITIMIFLTSASALFGQNLDSLGKDNSDTLNRQEVELLNTLLTEMRDTFDFQGKKVAFISGNAGNHILKKAEYFNSCIKPWIKRDATPQIFMVKLTQEEKAKSGGYDVLVLSWVKLFTNKQRRRIIERLATGK